MAQTMTQHIPNFYECKCEEMYSNTATYHILIRTDERPKSNGIHMVYKSSRMVVLITIWDVDVLLYSHHIFHCWIYSIDWHLTFFGFSSYKLSWFVVSCSRSPPFPCFQKDTIFSSRYRVIESLFVFFILSVFTLLCIWYLYGGAIFGVCVF